METMLEKGSAFIWQNARLLERAVFAYHFLNGSPSQILKALAAYQNEDGGFGHALEPDLRAAESQPLFVEFALRTLYENRLRDTDMAARACDFLAHHSDLKRGIPTLLPSAMTYARAAHWNNPAAYEPSFDRLSGLVGLASSQGIRHPWLESAVGVCLVEITEGKHDDSHTINNAFCLLESLSKTQNVDTLFAKLSGELFQANFFCLETPVRTYGLTPLAFAPTPDSYCRPLFTDAQIDAHLDELASYQEADGGWPIQWTPPGGTAVQEWRAFITVSSLVTLRAYARI